MPAPRRDHAIGAYARAAARQRVVAPGLEQLGLDPVEGLAHRLVVRPYHPALAEDERLERDRLRGRQREVEPRPVLALAVSHPAKAKTGVKDVPREHLIEPHRVHVPPEAKRARRPPVPEARPPVLGVVPRVVPVALEVVHRRLRGPELGHASDQRPPLRVVSLRC